MPTGFTGAPEAVGEVWKADWYIPHCYKIPALAQLNHLLAQIPRAPTRNDVWQAGAAPADLRRFHRDLGEVVSEAELAQKQLGIFLQAVQTTATGLQKEIGKRLSAENPSVFRKWIQKLPGFDDPLLAGGAGGGVGHGGSHSRSNSITSSGGAGSGGSGNAAGGKLTDGSNGSSPANKVSSESPGADSAPSLQPSKAALANRMRSKSMNVTSSGSLFRSPDDSGVAKPLGSEVSPIFASTGLATPGSNGSGAGSGAGGSATRKMFTRAFSVRERPSAASGVDSAGGGGNSIGNGGGGGGGFLDACGFSPVLMRARNAGRVGPLGEHEGEGPADTPVMGPGAGNGGNAGNGGVRGGGNGGNGGRDASNGGVKGGGASASGIGGDNAAFPAITENQQQHAPQGPLPASAERHSGPLLQGTVESPDSHADVALKAPVEKQTSAKPSGSSKGKIGALLFRSRSSRSSSHRWTQSQQQLQQRVAEEEEEGEEEEPERGRSSPSSGRRIDGGASGSRRVGGPRLTKSRSEKAPSSGGGGARGGARGGKSGHERLQEILSSVSSGWGGMPLSSPLSGSIVNSSGGGLCGGGLVARSATVSGVGPALGGYMGRAGGASVVGSASGVMSGSMSVSASGSGGISPRGLTNENFAFSHLPEAHRLSLASQSQDSSSSDYAMSPYGGSDRGVQAERGKEQEGGSGVLQSSRVLLSPAKAAQEEKLLEMLRSTPPVRWNKPGQAGNSTSQPQS